MTGSTTEYAKELQSRTLILNYNSDFNRFLDTLQPTTKQIITNNKQLNQMYDLFLDFIIDSNLLVKKLDPS